MNVDFTWFDLHGAPVSIGLSFTVSYCQGEAVFPLHQVSQKQHCLVVRVVQYILLEWKDIKDLSNLCFFKHWISDYLIYKSYFQTTSQGDEFYGMD